MRERRRAGPVNLVVGHRLIRLRLHNVRENIFFFLLLLVASVFCWVGVANQRFRRAIGQPIWPVSKEGADQFDAMAFVVCMIGALVFSLVTITVAVVAAYRFLAH